MSKLLLVWNDKDKQRYFEIDEKKFGRKRIHLLRKVYIQSSMIDVLANGIKPDLHNIFNTVEEMHEELWMIRAGMAREGEWCPQSVPPDWRRCLVEYETTRPSVGKKFEVIVLSITG